MSVRANCSYDDMMKIVKALKSHREKFPDYPAFETFIVPSPKGVKSRQVSYLYSDFERTSNSFKEAYRKYNDAVRAWNEPLDFFGVAEQKYKRAEKILEAYEEAEGIKRYSSDEVRQIMQVYETLVDKVANEKENTSTDSEMQ